MTNFLGRQIKAKRLEQHLSLKGMAEKTGLSSGFLSMVERGLAQPSTSSLQKIMNALDLKHLSFEDPKETGLEPLNHSQSVNRNTPERRYITEIEVVYPEKRKKLMYPYGSILFELLTPDLNRQLQVMYFTIEPGYEAAAPIVYPPGEKFGLILSGALEMTVGDKTFQVYPGCSMSYPADAPTSYRVIGDEPVECLLVITPPWF
ncbi:MAG: XRE family transcriptional regulator [Pseudomonadota bacterium]